MSSSAGSHSVPTASHGTQSSKLTSAIRYWIEHPIGAIGSTLIPPTVMREIDGEWGSVQEFRYGYKTYATSHSGLSVDEETAFEASVLDFLMGNTDRHGNNYMVNQSTGELLLIDHGLCFPEDNRELNFTRTDYYMDGPVPDALMERIKGADWNTMVSKLQDNGFEAAAYGFEQRLQWLLTYQSTPTHSEVQHAEWESFEVDETGSMYQ